MKNTFLIISFMMLFACITHAQNELGFDFDYARFNYDSSSVYLEFYYELNPKNMTAIKTDKGLICEAIVHIEMKDSAASTFFMNKDWKIQHLIEVNQNDSTTNSSLSGVFGFVVPKGKYSLKINAKDSRNSQLVKNISETIKIEPIKKGKYCISDIQLASNIKTDGVDTKSLFYKNTMEIIPNPKMLYTKQSPALFYYSELYQLKVPDSKIVYTLQKLLSNSKGRIVYKNSKSINQSPNSVVEYGVIKLSKYPTDSYVLTLSLIDPSTNQAFISKKRFYLYNPNVADSSIMVKTEQGYLGSEFANYSREECDKLFAEAKYIAAQREIDIYKGLDSLKAKREFLYTFWVGRDPSPETPRNEFLEEYQKRIDYVEENFTTSRKKGYLTDRGRVVLMYGIPDQRDLYNSDANRKPSEKWFYNEIEGGVKFIFADLRGFGDFELLHSSKRDEIKNEDWESRIKSHE
jgi:GWxTD domain-containing protein